MINYRIDLEYDGTDFRGWQKQPGLRTVQGELGMAIERIARQPVQVVGAGRTDAGVHAMGQVASFSSDKELEGDVWRRRLNRGLPEDVRVLEVRRVPDEFSARHSAIARCYRFAFLRQPSAIWKRYFHVLPNDIDFEAMTQATEVFLGEQDFTAFAATGAAENYRCLVSRSQLHVHDHEAYFEITANRFLHNMVRRLAGALVEVGKGRYGIDDLREILQQRDRQRGGPCLPPHGLYLVEVRYPGEKSPHRSESMHRTSTNLW